MVKTVDSLLEEYKKYSDPHGKIRRDVKNNLIFPIIRGLYETDDKTSGLLLASVIYGPSYISFEYALSYHGLIPERVVLYTNATFNKRRSKMFKTNFGNYYYRDIPKDAYPYGIQIILHDKYVVFMAKPEKALLDKLYTISPVSNKTELKKLLFEDLRIDEEMFANLDKDLMIQLIPKYKSTNLNILKTLIEKETVKE
ncbi:MAG: hypothetical protein RBQ97_10675 [Acholeplasma sp.]|nr:hypothetical protein [Acholeplasma sp.]